MAALTATYIADFVAEREGFEPSVQLPVHMISNHAPSAARTPLHVTYNTVYIIIVAMTSGSLCRSISTASISIPFLTLLVN